MVATKGIAYWIHGLGSVGTLCRVLRYDLPGGCGVSSMHLLTLGNGLEDCGSLPSSGAYSLAVVEIFLQRDAFPWEGVHYGAKIGVAPLPLGLLSCVDLDSFARGST